MSRDDILLIVQVANVILQAGSIIALIVYVVKTWHIATATKDASIASQSALVEMRETRYAESAPYVVSTITWNEHGFVGDDFFTAPDVLFEILSPGQRTNALVRRCLWFVEHGVRAAVLADPYDLSLIVFRSGLAPLALSEGDTLDLSVLLPGLVLSVSEIFAALRR